MKTEMKEKIEYVTPVLTVVKFKVEQGFVGSDRSLALSQALSLMWGTQSLESREITGDWGDGSWY